LSAVCGVGGSSDTGLLAPSPTSAVAPAVDTIFDSCGHAYAVQSVGSSLLFLLRPARRKRMVLSGTAVLGEQLSEASFCDWTEDGNLLVNARKGGEPSSDWGLVILDKSGNVMRELVTAVRPCSMSSGASWRKYGHQ